MSASRFCHHQLGATAFGKRAEQAVGAHLGNRRPPDLAYESLRGQDLDRLQIWGAADDLARTAT